MKETITVFFEQHWPSVANAPYAAVAAIAVAAGAIVFFFGCFAGWLFAKRNDQMTETITAFFKRHWPRAVNMPLAVLSATFVALAVAFLSLWLAKSTEVSYGFLRLVDSVLSPTVVFVGIIAWAFVWFVNKFSEEIRVLISRVEELAGAKFHSQRAAPESATTDSPAKAKADEESTGKNSVSDSVIVNKGESGVKSETAKTATAGDSLAEIKRKAEEKDAEAQYNLGGMYIQGKGVEQDDAEAVKWFRRAAGQGNVNAEYALGWMYAQGRGVERDDAEAVRLYHLAAEQKHVVAQYSLGVRYANGMGVEQDDAEAVRLYHLAAEQEHANAQYNLGCMYAQGRGVERDDAEAVKLYRLAAKQKHADAQYNLGWMYANGRGVEQDDVEAVKLFRRAAEQKRAIAQCSLGVWYANGRGVPQDDAEAVRLYHLAAEQGYAAAQANLGVAYHNGKGIAQNYREAYIWHSIAAANGVKFSVKNRDDDAKLLSAEDLASAQAEATRRMEEIRKRAESGK